MATDERTLLQQAQDVLAHDTVRVELHPVLNFTQGTVEHGATVFIKPAGRWVKAPIPMILPSEGKPQTRVAVLHALADIIESDGVEKMAPEALLTWQSVANLEHHTDIGPGNVTPLLIQVNFRQWEAACDLLREVGHLR